MKAMSLAELQDHIKELNTLKGAQLQEIETHTKGLQLSLYRQGRIWWLLELTPQQPMSVVLFEETPWRKKIGPKPLALFLNSNARNLYFVEARLLADQGRIFEVELASKERKLILEIHLIPKAVNVVARIDGKSISWAKPRDLAPAPSVEGSHRESSDIKFEWLKEQAQIIKSPNSAVPVAANPEVVKIQQAVQKKKKALLAMQAQLDSDEGLQWSVLGELLKSQPISELPVEWASFLKENLSRNDLMQKCFQKNKLLQKKKQGTFDRIEILTKEIAELEKALATGVFQKVQPVQGRQQLKDAGAEGRTKTFSGFVASKGKSASDNLALLRSAKAWDLWVHLRDYPSSHVIVARDKNQKVPDLVLHEAALWLAESSMKSKLSLSGTRLDVVVAECRFVRPIKGDKIGRVHYQNERTFTIIIP